MEIFDHDYHYLSEGAIIPHRIYDMQRNEGYISIGNSHETAHFTVKELFSKTKMDTGLKVFIRLNLKEYHTGIKTVKSELDFSRIQFNQNIPKLSYRIAA